MYLLLVMDVLLFITMQMTLELLMKIVHQNGVLMKVNHILNVMMIVDQHGKVMMQPWLIGKQMLKVFQWEVYGYLIIVMDY